MLIMISAEKGVAYHDSDPANHGSGELNPVNGSYLHEFRMNEGVDTSYVKGNEYDNNPYNFVEPELGLLFHFSKIIQENFNLTLSLFCI